MFQAREQLRKLAESDRYARSFDMDQLTDYEMIIANHLVDPNDIKVSWSSIAGLDSVIQELKETVILPIQRKELFEDSQLTQAPKVSDHVPWREINILDVPCAYRF